MRLAKEHREAPVPLEPYVRPSLMDDPNVVAPRQVREGARIAEAFYDPHAMFTITCEVLRLGPEMDTQRKRIADGISEAINIILAQHGLHAQHGGKICIEWVSAGRK